MNKWIVSSILILFIAATSWSLLHPQLFRVHDFIHAARVAEMARGISDGQIPVRWSANFAYGYGMPLFEFYSPLPYAVGALLLLARIPLDIVVRLLFLIPSVMSVIIAYKLGKLWFAEPTALLFAGVVALAPYRALNLYVRGAVAESWGMTFMLLTMYGMSGLVWKKKNSIVYIVLGLVGLVLSHNLSVLVAFPVLAIWILVVIVAKSIVSKRKAEHFFSSLWTESKSVILSLFFCERDRDWSYYFLLAAGPGRAAVHKH